MSISEALVVAGYGKSFLLETPHGQRILAVSKGKKKAAVVGDRVQWSGKVDSAVITAVLPRHNVFYRQDELRSKIFAANVDLIIILLAVQPRFSPRQLIRATVAARAAGIAAVVALNKVDLPQVEAEKQKIVRTLAATRQVLTFSVQNAAEDCLAKLTPLLQNRRTLLVGASGVGKSSLINLLVPDVALKTAQISQALNSGRHTTTSTCLYWLPQFNTAAANTPAAIIDSPGFQDFGVQHLAKEELLPLFPDLQLLAGAGCKFNNCSHIHEPHCAVKSNLTTEQLQYRYELYVDLYTQLSGGR